MPLVHHEPLADTVLPHALANVVTTTIYPNGTAVPVAVARPKDPVPVGAIAGGASAGAFIAVAAVVGWLLWGKKIKQTKLRQRKEAEALRATKRNTRQNASLSAHRPYSSYMPGFARPLATRVKFVASDTKPAVSSPLAAADVQPPPPASEKSRPVPSTAPSSYNYKPKYVPAAPPSNVTPSKPMALRPAKPSPGPGEPGHARIQRQGLRPTFLPHKPSTLSSGSHYSTQTGEEHVPANSILAALGYLLDGRRWSSLTRSSGSAYSSRDGHQHGPSRLSQASSGSAYSQPENQTGVPIGLAYGGDE